MSQTIHKPLRARVWALAAALLVACGAALATASPAHAHDEILGSDPAQGSTVEALPAQLTLTFSAEIADDSGASVVEVTDAAGTSLVDGAPVARDNVLTQALAGEASGAVTVLWKVVSSDGHPISGELSFTVTPTAEPSAEPTAEPTPVASPTATTESATPTPAPTETAVSPDDADSTFGQVWPWLLLGIVAIGAAGAVVYLMVSRARRENALAEGPASPAAQKPAQGSAPESDTPADQ